MVKGAQFVPFDRRPVSTHSRSFLPSLGLSAATTETAKLKP